MSSPLDGRIRAIAREEVSALLGDAAAPLAVAVDAGPAQAETIAELQAQVKRLSDRLDEVERASGDEQRPAARRTRKTAE
ncbi:hypothetical protein AB0J81_09020 [Streptomyces bobili]|uniref:hypothetical protein n=1 Tax=Streptomyces bobili TaxID=67280 RepID=UPI0034203D5B